VRSPVSPRDREAAIPRAATQFGTFSLPLSRPSSYGIELLFSARQIGRLSVSPATATHCNSQDCADV
jgi:hypothetical protein